MPTAAACYLDESVGRDLVARRIAQIGGISTGQVAARAGLAFVGTAGGQARGMERIDLGRAGRCEADGCAIARRRLAIAGASDDERGLVTTIQNPAAAERPEVLDAERAQGGVVESGGLCDVGSTDEYVRENVVAGDNGLAMRVTFQVSIENRDGR
jgi:hypothetical protein